MPVFSKVRDGILVVAVDGDYTSTELRRAGAAGLGEPGLPRPARVLLDMSGAAGISRRSPEELRTTADFFAGLSEEGSRVAILAPDDLAFGLMRMAEAYYASKGRVAKVFRDRGEAVAWLAGSGSGTATEEEGSGWREP